MKAQIKNLLGLAILLMSAAIVNCAGSGSSSSPAATTPYNNLATACPQYASLPSCGTNMVSYNGQCISIQQICPQALTGAYGTSAYGYGTTGYGTSSYGQTCPDGCGSGLTKVNGRCYQQYTCGTCYAYSNGQCYAGDYLTQSGLAY